MTTFAISIRSGWHHCASLHTMRGVGQRQRKIQKAKTGWHFLALPDLATATIVERVPSPKPPFSDAES